MNNNIKLSIYLFLAFFLISSSFAAMEIFSEYNTEITVNSNSTIDVHKTILLQNIHTTGLVPGNIEFKINKKINNSDSEIKITNIRLYDRYNNPIKFKSIETKDYNVISFDIFSPLLPGFEYKLDLYYTFEYESSGFFFKSIEVPIKEITTIPIEEGSFKISIPENYGFTYISHVSNNSQINKNNAMWQFNKENKMPETIAFEYSYIPLKFGELRGSILFWIIIDIVLFSLLILDIVRRIKKSKKEKNEN